MPSVTFRTCSTNSLYQNKDTAQASGYRGCLGVPMVREGQVVGAIFVARRLPGLFADAQVQLLKTFADQAVIAIENVRLFDEVQARTRELSEALEQQTATSEVLQVISSSPGDLEPVFQAMLANATRLCEAKFGNSVPARRATSARSRFTARPPAFADWFRRRPAIVMRDPPGTRARSPRQDQTSRSTSPT